MVTVGEVLNSVLFVFLQANEENCSSSPCESAEYLQELAKLYQSQHGSTLIHLIPFSCSMYNGSCKGGNRRLKGAHQTSWITTPGCPKASPTSSLWLIFPWYCAFWWYSMGQEGMCSVGGGVPLRKWRRLHPN